MIKVSTVILFLICCIKPLFPAEITLVYPRSETNTEFSYPISIDSTFVFGRVTPPLGNLYVNGAKVSFNGDGAFLAYLPIKRDSIVNSWVLYLINDDDTLAKTAFPYLIKSDTEKAIIPEPIDYNSFFKIVSVIDKNSHIRTAQNGSYFVFPEKGCKLKVLNQTSQLYEVEISPLLNGYIEKKSVELCQDTTIEFSTVGNGSVRYSNNSSICSFKLDNPTIWNSQLSADCKTLSLTLYNTKSSIERVKYDLSVSSFIDDIVWNQVADGVQLEIRCADKINKGYSVVFNNDSLLIIIKQSFNGKISSILGKIIVIDSGHGGSAKGSIGPMGTMEKDATFRWAELLSKKLEQQHAVVKLTRTADMDLDLYSRNDFALSEDADLFISLHFNALPDGENPFIRHGLGTYYYQTISKSVSKILHKHLLEKSKLRDDGLFDASFAVLRPTNYLSVLIEGAYIIYPDEEKLINSDTFLNKMSEGIVEGLKEYFKQHD